uniref:Transposase n=1 Tax=viral metagenome TaxID=1070528 RepID=A0A6M3K5I9_9ZZZZ
MKKQKIPTKDYSLELVLNRIDSKGNIVGKISKQFQDGNSLYAWAQKMRPQWKFE